MRGKFAIKMFAIKALSAILVIALLGAIISVVIGGNPIQEIYGVRIVSAGKPQTID